MFPLPIEDEEKIEECLKEFIKKEEVQSMKNYLQHGNVSTYEHCMQVVRVSFWINKKFKLNANQKQLIIGAFLHDFFLYDWHDPGDGSHQLHGFSHPEKASINAKKYFRISSGVRHIIECHMWPLTITRLPKSREAVIVCIADKCCSLNETLFQRKSY